MLKKINIIILFFFTVQFTFSQSMDRLKTPYLLSDFISNSTYKKIINKKNGFSIEELIEGETTGLLWTVMSDRANNTLYEDAERDFEIDNKMDIGQKAWVTDYDGNMLHLVNYDDPTIALGWISAKKLILNQFSYISDKRQVLYKAMILLSMDEITNIEDDITQGDKKKLYHLPDNNSKTMNEANKFDFYYVLKEADDWILLSKNEVLDGSSQDAKNRIMGWIKKREITEWNHNVCMEPNNKREVVTAYKDNPVYVFKSEVGMEKYDDEGYNEEYVVRQFILERQPLYGYEMRMPIINEENYETYKQVATIANIKKSKDAKSISKDDLARYKSELTELKEKINNVNVLFVIDGTQSLKKYASKIKQSIRDIVTLSKEQKLAQNLKFAIAVYRDYNESGSLKRYEFFDYSDNVEQISSSIDNILFSSNQAPHYEAMYYGLYNGINDAFENNSATNGQSNIVVLVGDAGDDEKSNIKIDQIVQLMEKNNVNLIAYQAKTYGHRAYAFFSRQVKKILMGVAKTYENEFEFSWSKKKDSNNNVEIDNSYEISFNVDGEDNFKTPMYGALQTVRQDGDNVTTIDEEELKKNVVSGIKGFIQKKSDQYNFIENFISGAESGSLDPSDINYKYLFRWFKDNITPTPSDEKVRQLIRALQNQGEISARGWIKMQYDGIDEDAFYPVVFMSKVFKDRHIQRALKKIIASESESNTTETRKKFEAAIVALVGGVLVDSPVDDIKNMTFNEVWEVILGVKFKNSTLGRKKIKDVRVSSQISDNDFQGFFRTFKREAEDFLRYEYNDQYSTWKEGQQTYYWIPVEDLPFSKI